jgi:hypothetical protein
MNLLQKLTADQPDHPKRLLWMYRLSFAVTMIFIAIFMYGFTLLLKPTIHSGEVPSLFGSMMEQARQDGNAGGGSAEAQDSLQQAQPPAQQQQRPRSRLERARREGELSFAEILAGLRAGQEHPTALAFVWVGLSLTVVFGFLTIGLFAALDPQETRDEGLEEEDEEEWYYRVRGRVR